MKNSRLATLAIGRASGLDVDRVIVEALAERLRGEEGPACEALARRMEERPRAAAQPGSAAWCTYGEREPTTAHRRDGVHIDIGNHPRLVASVNEGPRWYVLFPPLAGGVEPVAELPTAETLRDAMEEVDQRWPMPKWWSTLDQRSGVVDACAALNNGHRCTRAPGHAGAHVAMGFGELLATWEAS